VRERERLVASKSRAEKRDGRAGVEARLLAGEDENAGPDEGKIDRGEAEAERVLAASMSSVERAATQSRSRSTVAASAPPY
jgi:hypothetical protein